MTARVQSGREVRKVLDRSTDRLGQQLDRHVTDMRQLDGEVNQLVERRGDALLELSRHYLPDISLRTVEGAFHEVRDELMDVFARKQRRGRQLEGQIDDSERIAQQLDAKLDDVTEQLNQKAVEREELEELLVQRLHGSDEFQVLSRQALQAELELEKNEERVTEINQEAAEKLPSYKKSRLFQYLHERGYGTGDYKKSGLTRRLDGWVAKMIGFDSARRSYNFLRVTPKLMAQEVERRRDQFNQLMEKVEQIEDRVADEIGLTRVMREGQEIGAQRDRLVADLGERRDAILAFEEELLRLEGDNSEFYEQAVARMKNFLSTMRESRLQRHSRGTPQTEDDAIVAEVVWLKQQLNETRSRGAALAEQRGRWEDRLTGLREIQQRFRHAEYDSRRSVFDARFDVQRLIDEYLHGRMGPEGLWTEIRRRQKFIRSQDDWHDPSWTDVFDDDFSHVLFRVLADVAGHALRNAAYRGMKRRGPIRGKGRRRSGRPRFPYSGFTRGRGF